MRRNKLILSGLVSILAASMTTFVFAMKGEGDLNFERNDNKLEVNKKSINDGCVVKLGDYAYEIHKVYGKFGSINTKKVEINVRKMDDKK